MFVPHDKGQLSPDEWDELLAPVSGLTKKQRGQLQQAWVLRWSGLQEHPEPMVGSALLREHSKELLRLLLRMHVDTDAVVAGLLVEPVEQDLLLLEEVVEKAGKRVGKLSRQIKSVPVFAISSESTQKEQRPRRREQVVKAQAEMFRRMLLAMSQDLRVVLVLLVVRLHRMRLLAYVPVAQHIQIARECREIYVPLANRLGISWIKQELEDVTFRYLYPHDFYGLVSAVDSTQLERQEYIEEVQGRLGDLLKEHEVPGQIKGRPKHLNSIFRKMMRRHLTFEDLYDIIAFRLICETKAQCYQMLGVIHDTWKPIPGRFKDYIALPKSNMYQSLHTTVLGPRQKRMEIQIRTRDMDLVAEDGIAAHWLYKEGGSGAQAAGDVQWLRSLLQLQDEKVDADDFVASVRDHLFVLKVFVFTPKGDIRELRRGSTPIDFAFAIHTEVGLRCVGARVNNKMVPLRYELHNGDICEIMTSPSARPNRGWLELAQSARAKNKIRAFLRTEQREQAIVDGRDRLERELPPGQRNVSRLRKSGALDKVCERMGLTAVDELLAQIGYGKVNAGNIARILFPPEQKEADNPLAEEKPRRQPFTRPSSGGVLVEGLEDIMVRMARCCHPIPGDPIVGFISRGRGVIVHRRDCSRLQKAELQRQIGVRWADDDVNLHGVSLRIITENRPSLLSQISQVFDNLNIQISRANCRSLGDESVNLFRCHVSNVRQLQRLIRQISDIRGVINIERLRN